MSYHEQTLLEGLTVGEAKEQLSQLIDKLETINFLLSSLEELMQRTPFILESISSEVIRFREKFRESEDGIKNILELAYNAVDFLGKENLASLLNGLLEAYTEVKQHDYRTSITGIVRAMTDPDVQRALAFVLLTLKKMGMSMR
ncbi:protein of unknown function DUF1641 [Hydrogenobacter thermophilus TK-6]|uniref:DUF1641 domain-containing protein n=1 Tax=Hydrogenobacter thermophilus (strain DSM 6534 / IAM 12695 / TK-6) TaxID=608538 RepID=D3DGG9_HYDTT|nr:DUF1641 domain-containing protein [Hydrogenobacter thermophilus]ADO44856.1 protein of unknown function DUF1641 [Hydrogenobacter thermophilus TK-6]BAI68921.1 hypothetical protein HTH_0457 [Hydrogenobacter thermophilus TK-6]